MIIKPIVNALLFLPVAAFRLIDIAIRWLLFRVIFFLYVIVYGSFFKDSD